MTINATFVTVIVIKVDVFESVIQDEKHFQNMEEAKAFQATLPAELLSVIASLT